MRLYLASTSPARAATLKAVGLHPHPLPPQVDEEIITREASPIEPAKLVTLLARAKAEAVAARIVSEKMPDGLVLGGDSAFAFAGQVYGKPQLPDTARERLLAQRGRSGVLHTGHWLISVRNGQIAEASGGHSSAVVYFAMDVTDAEIDAYIATGEPLKVAGAFTIDALGAAFVDRIEGDPHTVVGLSVPLLRRLVRSHGVTWTSLWRTD